ncbi:MAG: methionine ABC transporter ATP-binding protein [Brotaphodocola sp.]
MIKLEQVCKSFDTASGNVHAVKDVSLEIQDGEIFGIIGFSGAGKSTLVRCINLLERPTSGKVLVDEVELTALDEKQLRDVRKKIGMIFQHFNLMRSRTVYQNIEFPLKKTKLSRAEREKKIMSLLELVGLTDKKNAYPSQLSGGQKQRVAIARALANDPKVLLCDEATSALDPQTTQAILKLLKRVNEEMDITIILITHEMAVVKDICDRVAIMENGYMVESGDTVDVFCHPQQPITKDFIDTASNIRKIYDLIEEGNALTKLEKGDKMLLLTYSGSNAGEPLISYLSKNYNIGANIIYGNIDYLKGKPLGKLVVTLSGQPENVKTAMDYIDSLGVEVEVIKG